MPTHFSQPTERKENRRRFHLPRLSLCFSPVFFIKQQEQKKQKYKSPLFRLHEAKKQRLSIEISLMQF